MESSYENAEKRRRLLDILQKTLDEVPDLPTMPLQKWLIYPQ
jgi:hypothetical protein